MDTIARTLLVVADTPTACQSVNQLLATATHLRAIEATPDLATTTLLQTPCDCLLLCSPMPNPDVLQFITAIRAVSDLPLLLLTDADRATYAVDALQHGAQDYLLHSELTPELLITQIERAIAAVNHDREREHARLHTSELRYSKLVASMQEGFLLCELIRNGSGQAVDFRYLEVNPAIEALSGLKPSETVGRLVSEVVPHLDERWMRAYQQAVDSGEPVRVEYYTTPLSRWYDAIIVPYGGELFAVLFDDITDRKQSEVALQVSEARYRTLFETMVQGVIYYDAELRIIGVNLTAEQILEQQADTLIGRTITLDQSFTILREDGTPLPAEEHPALIALHTRQVVRGVVLGLTAPGQQRVRWLRIDVVPTFEAGQEAPTQFYALFEDISVQRQTEQTIRAEQQQLTTILETMEEALLVIRPDGSIALLNRMARQLSSISVEHQVGSQFDLHTQSGLIAIGPDGQELPLEQGPISRAMRGERFSGMELCLREPSGSAVRWLSCSGAPVYAPDGSLKLGVITIQDISSRKQDAVALQAHTDALRQANAELTRALRLKDEFLAMMSHELRTPLHVILGFSEALDEQIYGPLTSEQHQALANVSQSGRHLLAILSDILDLAHFETGKEQLDLAPVEVEHLCRTALQFVQAKAQAKSIRMLRTLEDGIHGLRADERRLTQVLVNLLDNAVKFTPANGRVGLEVTADPEQEQIQFVVWDTGVGIAEADYGRLFQPFSQLDSRLSREYGGIGLGLTLVRRLVDLHGGSVSLSSKPGEGSHFTVTLPWSTQDNVVPPVVMSPGAPLQPTWSWAPRLLLAEDHELTLRLYSELLRQQGCTVTTAYNGEEALARAQEERPDLVIMDIQMPVMDGLTAIRRMRADLGLAQVPIIALTALAMPGDRERCMEAGANRYLAKPVSLYQLSAVMSELFSKGGNSVL